MLLPTPSATRTSQPAQQAQVAREADDAWCQARGLEHFENFSAAVDQTCKKESVEGRRQWKEWVGSAEDKGHKRAHAFAKLPAAWVPQETTTDEGVLTGDPAALLNGQRKKFKGLWQAEDVDEHGKETAQKGLAWLFLDSTPPV